MNILSKPLFWAIIVFLCAAIFRLTALDLIEFKLDEARDVYEMELFWQNPTLLERGTIQSTGVYNPPLWYYFLAVISAPSRDPQYLSFMVALINCVAVAGFYLVIKKFLDPRLRGDDKKEWFGIAEAAGLLLAFSPWSILFSRKIWAPDMILPLLVPFLYFLFVILFNSPRRSPSATIRGVDWAWFGLVLTLSLLAQLHASGIFLAVVSIIIITIIKIIKIIEIPIDWKFALLGLALSLIPLIPYINYQIRTDCEDCRNYSAYQEGEAVVVPFFDGNAFLRPFQFINGSGFDNTLGDGGFRDFQEKYPLVSFFNFIFLLEFLLLPLGIFAFFRSHSLDPPAGGGNPEIAWIPHQVRDDIKKMGIVLVGILVLIPVLYFLTKTPSHLYYLLIVSPISILIYAFGAFHLRGGKMLHLGGVILGAIIIINIIFELMFVNYLSGTQVIPGDYGATYGVVKEMAGEKQGLERAEFWVNLFNGDYSSWMIQ